MPSLQKIKWLFLAMTLFLCANFGYAQDSDSFDEDSPEITARVARISFIRGDVQVKRAGETDWENVSLNLPLVEGDELATAPGARVEIQFDSRNFLRLAENSVLEITTLRDEGIAVSLKEGLLSLRVFDFEKEKGYFELDAPQSTVAVQQAGSFRIDAREAEQVRITVTEGGEARIYSDTSAFTIRSGRSAAVFLGSDRLGEWETAAADQYFDEWDSWVAERDSKLANLLNNSYYDKYYDRDIYGAEDLNDHGSWSDSDDYGQVWRPNYTAISNYNNWSPYRYGHWRWINPYGWVWINDEPWGWATSHYGRWIYDSRGWGWTPYSYYRPKRSWWKPALVAIFNINNDVCWYPLSHRDRYRDYNRNYRRSDRNFGSRRDNYGSFSSTVYQRLPENSITAVRSDDFGRRRNSARSISTRTVQQTLANNPVAVAQLPKFEERRREFRHDAGFRLTRQPEQIRTGVLQRRSGVEMDKQLQNERFRNNRREERIRQSGNSNSGTPNSTVNDDSKRNERFERRDRGANSEPSNQSNRRVIVPPSNQPSSTVTDRETGGNDEPERRNRERRPPRNEEQRPVNLPSNNNSNDEVQRPRANERNGNENRVIVRVPENNSMDNNRREQRRNENSENNNRSEERRRNQENNNQNNVRRDDPPANRPTYYPRNNEENRRNEAPGTENTQPREQPRREERREEMRREEPRREQPRQETPRVEIRREEPRVETRREEPRVERREEPRQEQPRREERREQPRQEQPRQEPPRVERREEPRREVPRQESPRQEPPRQREQPREERRPVPKTERKPDQPIDN